MQSASPGLRRSLPDCRMAFTSVSVQGDVSFPVVNANVSRLRGQFFSGHKY